MKKGVTIFLFGLLLLLIINSILRGAISFLNIGNIGFTLVFTLFSVAHSIATLGSKRTIIFLTASAVISWIFEEIGVRTGLVFGSYVYSDMLGPKLGNVPIVVPLAWFMMIYPSWIVAGVLLGDLSKYELWKSIVARSFIASMVMTMWDVVMEPSMAARGNWTWLTKGDYFGVPFQNFLGWIVTTFIIYSLTELIFHNSLKNLTDNQNKNNKGSEFFLSLPVIVYTFYSILYMTPRFPESVNALRIVTFFTMTFVGLLALIRLLLKKDAAYPFENNF